MTSLEGLDLPALRKYLDREVGLESSQLEASLISGGHGQTVGDGFDRIGALVGPMTEAGHRQLDEGAR